MSKKNCAAGLEWNSPLKTCMPPDTGPRHPTPTEPSITALVQLAAFNPTLWIFVLLTTLGSILALALWLILYRRHTLRHTGEEPAPPSEAHNTIQQCQHLHTVLHTAPRCADCVSTAHEGQDWSVLTGSAVRQETVPLPATELVTTKTL